MSLIASIRTCSPAANCRRARQPRGFTLVELLVVIGIIALLLAILLPTLANARRSAMSVQCLSTLRQFAQANVMYANEQDGWVVPATGGGSGRFQNLPVWLQNDLFRKALAWNLDAPWRYAPLGLVCSEADLAMADRWFNNGDYANIRRAYAINRTKLDLRDDGNGGENYYTMKLAVIDSASTKMFVLDSVDWRTGWGNSPSNIGSNPEKWLTFRETDMGGSYVAYRHGDDNNLKANASFYDGSASTVTDGQIYGDGTPDSRTEVMKRHWALDK